MMSDAAGFLRTKGFELLELAVAIRHGGGDPDRIHRLGIEMLCRAIALEHAVPGEPSAAGTAWLH